MNLLEQINKEPSFAECWLANMDVGLFITDGNGTIHWVNNALCHMLNYAQLEILSKKHRDLIVSPQDQITSDAMVEELISGRQKSYTLIKSYLSKSDEAIPVKVSVHKCEEFLVATVVPMTRASANIISSLEEISNKLASDRAPNFSNFLSNVWMWIKGNPKTAGFLILSIGILIWGDTFLEFLSKIAEAVKIIIG